MLHDQSEQRLWETACAGDDSALLTKLPDRASREVV